MSEENTNDEKLITIQQDSLEWNTPGGFIALYLSYANEETTLKAAYEKAEADFQKIYKRRRYLDYSNFIRSKWNYHSRLLDKNKTK